MTDTPSLSGRHIVLGITGGIAAYKTPELVRRLQEQGAEIRVILTRTAQQFVTHASLTAVGATIVQETSGSMAHIDLARWADLILIAPGTAHVLARLATGAADDLLTTTCLASEAPVAIAPAMNQVMWQKAVTQANCQKLRERGVMFIGPDDGSQACGDTGPGRMREIAGIVAFVAGVWAQYTALAGITAVVTAGPTYEALDPVRGLTNRSSGKMGYALAEALALSGASVILVSGPTALPTPARVHKVAVTTAIEMHDAVVSYRSVMRLFIATAAVADYRPQTALPQKLKKTAETLQITLVRNPDILAEVASWQPAPFTVGFAAESENLAANGREKLLKKGLDLVVANPIGEPDAGFGGDNNRITLIDKDGATAWPMATKTAIARELIAEIVRRLPRNPPK
ncbi:MAG TPA: bifunctional phosphopantothenoylcysteine decarboxylase/phosphopantothenate--cysteine ligase CoaBC [Acidiferrobacter sp.]|nr:bifunctional phosphopantothenoylcysteine decarboxylase/phosphopantothenate--cysteine ligase CoaBC [Acidiferrobacter sp.]